MKSEEIIGLLFVFLVIGLAVFGLGYNKGESDMEKQAVKEGHGYYDPQTREFKFGRLK